MSETVLTIKSTDITSMRDAVNAASNGARASWLGFLGLTTYLFIAIAGVSHQDLLLNTPVSLPLFQVQIPLDRFFFFAPVVFAAIHFGVLVQHVLLTQKVAVLHELMSERESETGTVPDPIRFTLDSYFVTQAIAGPARRTLLAAFLDNTTWLSLVVVPVLLLLAFQIGFLPYHDLAITWAHRVVLAAELVMIVLLGAYLGSPVLRLASALWNTLRHRPLRLLTAVVVAIAAGGFSAFVATIPGERLEHFARAFGTTARSQSGAETLWLTKRLFEGRIDPITGRASSPFLRNLVVTDADLVTDDRNQARTDRTISLRGRDLRFATLDRTDLQNADLTGANLRQASLQGTRLTDAVLTAADLRGGLFWRTGQEDVDFVPADLSGAVLRRARLDSANLHGVRARGTDFSGANLIGATFLNADLQGADFRAANLIAVGFAGAILDGSRFKDAKLDAARFERARLVGADLSNTALYRVQLQGTNLTGADLRGGPVWATPFPGSTSGLDTRFRIPSPPNSRHTKWLQAQLASAWTPDDGVKLRANIGSMLDTGSLRKWKGTTDHKAWSAIRSQPIWSADQIADLTDLLSQTACEDSSVRANVAAGIARRASDTFLFAPQFNGDLLRFAAALNVSSCLAARRLPTEAIQELRRAARLVKAARKVPAPQ